MTDMEPEITPEVDVIPEVENEPEEEPEMGPEVGYSDSEPEPDWPKAFTQWGNAWPLHVYAFGSFFLTIAVLVIVSMKYYVFHRHRLRQGKLTFTLQCLLLLFTSFRALVMFLNPYQTRAIGRQAFVILWSLALPGLTASFSALLLVLLDSTKMTLGPPIFQKPAVLLTFTAFHFGIVMASDTACFVAETCKPTFLFCQILFILYGSLLFIGYAYISAVLFQRSKAVDNVIDGAENRKLTRLIKISSLAALVSLSITVTHLYAASSEFGVYSDVIYVDPWSWWTLQSFLRLEELASACLILVIAFRNPFDETNLCWFKSNQSSNRVDDINKSINKTNTPLNNSSNPAVSRVVFNEKIEIVA